MFAAPDYEAPTDAGANNVYDVTVQVSDGAGGTGTQALAVTVTNVNEAPVLTLPGLQTTAEDTPLVFSIANGNAISLSDVDDLGNPEQVTLSVSRGTLTLADTTGVTFVAGADGTSSLTIQGTLADLNTALDGLTYTPDLDFNGADRLTITHGRPRKHGRRRVAYGHDTRGPERSPRSTTRR